MKKIFKNISKAKLEKTFLGIAPGETKTVEITGEDDIYLQAEKLGFLEEVKEEGKIVKKKKKR